MFGARPGCSTPELLAPLGSQLSPAQATSLCQAARAQPSAPLYPMQGIFSAKTRRDLLWSSPLTRTKGRMGSCR